MDKTPVDAGTSIGEQIKKNTIGYGNIIVLIITSINKIMKKNKSAGFFRKEKWLQINRIMRLLVLMVMCLNLSLSAKVYSQAERFRMQKKGATVKEIFDQIFSQSNYRFFYNNEFDVSRKIDIDVRNADLNLIINKILEGQDYSYKLMDNYVIIKRNESQTIPQNKYARQITGMVKDAEGNPLPGVTVRLKGTNLGVATDIDGKFIFSVPGPGAFLEFSFVGKKTQLVLVGDQSEFNIILEDDEKILDEVVCTGIQTLSRERATGAFEVLNAETIGRTLTSDVVSRFQGKIAGVQVDANNKVTIRGRGCINSDTDPLVMVDAFPIEAGIESVNPDDILTMTILKDAAAASIWGVRAANGVIVITTKSGQNQEKPTLDVSYFLTIDSKADYKDMHLISPSDAVDVQLELIQKGWWTPTEVDQYHSSVNKVQEAYYNAMKRLETGNYSLIATDPQFWSEIEELRNANLYKQFEKELLRRAVQNRLNISFRGGSEKSNYYLSAVYDHQALGSVGDKSDDLILNLKHDYKIANRLTFSTGINVEYKNEQNIGISIGRLADETPFHNLWDAEGNRIQYYMVDPWEGKNREEMGYLPYTTNMLNEQETNDYTTNTFSARLQAALKWNIIRGLDVETRFQYERAYTDIEDLRSKNSPYMRRLINDNTLVNADGQLINNLPVGAMHKETKNELEAWTWRSQLTYNGDWNDSKHMLTAVLGHEMRMYRTIGRSALQYGYDPDALTYVAIDETAWENREYDTWYGLPSLLDNGKQHEFTEIDNRDLSVFLNAAYTFAGKYSVSASGRMDRTNLFGNDSDYNYNFIWSSGLSWRISEEAFAKTDWMDRLMVRLTYGIGGNVNKNFFPMLMGSKGVSKGVPYIHLINPANKDLTWEKTTTINAGIDFAFLNYRIGGSVDYYHKKGTDLLGRVTLDPTNGFPDAQMNFASMLNQGVEVTLNTTPLVINDFRWNLGFNISYNKNEVTKVEAAGSSVPDYLEGAPGFGNGVAIVGKPLGRLYSYRYAGLDEQGQVMLWQGNEKVHYSAFDKNIENLKYEGTLEAPWYGGVNTSFEYKGITLSANATYKFGHKFRLPVGSASSPYSQYENIADRWRPGHTQTNVPVLLDNLQSTAQFEMEEYYSDADIHVRDAAFLRLNEISLGYTLPKAMIRKTPFKLIDIQCQIRNLALWTANKENTDPEAVYMPRTKSFILGVKLTF